MDYIFSDRISGLKPSAIREILKYGSDPKMIAFFEDVFTWRTAIGK